MGKTRSGQATPKKKPSARRDRLQKRIEGIRKGLSTRPGVVPVLALLACAIAWLIDHAAGASFAMIAGTKYALLYSMPDGAMKSGRSGSVVYQRNGVRRNFVVPSLVQNDFTQQVRGDFGINSNSWSGLTDEERASFNNAVGFTYVNRFGVTKILKGKALYVRLNQNLTTIGQAPITTCPLPIDVVGLLTFDADVDVTPLSENFALTFSPTPVAADTSIVVMATMPLPAGYSRPSASRYRIITIWPPATATNQNVVGDYTSKFGAVPEGAKVFFKAYAISEITGQASPVNIASGVAHT